MIRHILTILSVAGVAGGGEGRSAAGEGLLTRLPENGTWVSYTISQEQKRTDPQDVIRHSGTLTVRFLGADPEQSKPCRWFETEGEYVNPTGDATQRETAKSLIPEIALTGQSDPGASVIRCWYRSGQEEPPMQRDPAPEFLDAWHLTPPLTEREIRRSPRAFSFQSGRLDVEEQIHGHTEWRSGRGMVVRVRHQHWPHSDVPNGMAGMRLETEIIIRGESKNSITTEYLLKDFGTGAVSGLPNHR